MDKKEILDILDNAKDDRGAVPMRLVRQALDKLSAIQPISSVQPKPDCVSRQAAIDALDEQIEQCNKALGSFDISPKDEYAIKVERASLEAYKEQLENMSSAQPEIIRCKDCKYRYLDGMIWNCPFGLSGGEDFFCAYGAIGGGSGT